jgi:hypothetical protein
LNDPDIKHCHGYDTLRPMEITNCAWHKQTHTKQNKKNIEIVYKVKKRVFFIYTYTCPSIRI